MAQVEAENAHQVAGGETRQVDMRLEVVLVPISDDERGSEFHLCLGFRLSADFGVMENHRVVRFPPPDPTSPANVGAGAPSGMTGSLDGLTLMVSDVADALNELVRRGVRVSEIHDDETGVVQGGSGEVRVVGIDLGHRPDRPMAS